MGKLLEEPSFPVMYCFGKGLILLQMHRFISENEELTIYFNYLLDIHCKIIHNTYWRLFIALGL